MRDYADYENMDVINVNIAKKALKLMDIDELGLDAQATGDLPGNLNVETSQCAGCVVEREGRIGSFGTDLDDASSLDLLQTGLSKCGTCRGNLQNTDKQNVADELH